MDFELCGWILARKKPDPPPPPKPCPNEPTLLFEAHLVRVFFLLKAQSVLTREEAKLLFSA